MVGLWKIFVYNLEDFFESWEDKILENLNNNNKSTNNSIFQTETNYFIPPSSDYEEIQNLYKTLDSNLIKDIGNGLKMKFRVLKRSIGVFFSLD